MPGVSVDHNDAVEVFAAAGDAIARARQGGGPTLIEVQTDRYLGHFQGDAGGLPPEGRSPTNCASTTRSRRSAARCASSGVLDDARDEKIRSRAEQRVTAAYEFARDEPAPGPGRGSRARVRVEERRRETMAVATQGTHAYDGPGDLRGDRPGDGARRARVRDGRGRRELRRHLQRHRRPARPVRPGADHGHADLGGGVHRRRNRRCGRGHCGRSRS